MPPKTKVTIVSVVPAPRAAGTYTFDAGQPVPSGNTLISFKITIALADKLAVGKHFSWAFFFSADGGQTFLQSTSGGWTSYGPAGIVSPDGSTNPDPVLTQSLVGRAGQLLRGQLVLADALTAGVEITVV